jgi:hypothetical protein
MGKKSIAATALPDATKKAKKAVVACDPNAPIIKDCDRSKFVQKDLRKLAKDDFVKEGSDEVLVPGPETTPALLAGYRVMFLAFVLYGLFFPVHELFWGLLFCLWDSAA